MLIGGSPCTYWSIAKAGYGRETTSSGFGFELFMQYVRALREAKPKYFLYENNESMADDIRQEIFVVYRVFQDHSLGMEYLYYEESIDEQGKGKIINTNDLLCWGIKSLN